MPLYWSLLDKVLYLSKDVYDMFLIYTVSISTFCSQVTIFSLVKNSETFVKGAQYITYAMFYVLFIYLFFWCCFFFFQNFFYIDFFHICIWIQNFIIFLIGFRIFLYWHSHFLKLGFTPCKLEQPQWCMELQA